MKKKGIAAFLRRKQYVIAGALVVAAAVGTTVVYSNNQEKERQQMEAELAEEQEAEQMAAVPETEDAAAVSSVIPPKSAAQTQTANETATEETELQKTAELNTENSTEESEETAESSEQESETAKQTAETVAGGKSLHFSPEDGLDWPLEGNVILNYSMDATVYFATLDQYKYNPAVIIEGEINDKVYSVAKGKVISIENDEVTGCTMTVDLGDGYQAIYGQLKEPNFAKGDYVEAGHVLGYVGEPTKYFAVEGSNLYFALEKDGNPVDPMEFFE